MRAWTDTHARTHTHHAEQPQLIQTLEPTPFPNMDNN